MGKVFIVKEGDWEFAVEQFASFTGMAPNEKDDVVDAATLAEAYLKEASAEVHKEHRGSSVRQDLPASFQR
jgi:hypothetical protein